MAKVTGQARASYTPGAPRKPRFEVLAEGDYEFTLVDIGKNGLAGWKKGATPAKFPSRRVRFGAAGTLSEATGKEADVLEFVSASPKAFFKIEDLMYASGYPEPFEAEFPSSPNDSARLREYCAQIDVVLHWIQDNNIVLKGRVSHEEFKGRPQARVAWLDPEAALDADEEEVTEEDDVAFPDAEEEAPAEEEAELEEVEAEEEEEAPPPPAAKKLAAKRGKAK